MEYMEYIASNVAPYGTLGPFFGWSVLTFQLYVPLTHWIVSQVFAFISFIFSFWSWQVKNKVRMMFLVGTFSAYLVLSAFFLENYTLTLLFGLAAIRNYVFCYLDWRVSTGKYVAKWLPYAFAGLFASLTIISTVVLVHILQVRTYSAWLEWLICLTLLGLIIGNILKGTNLMRISFIGNRIFNIINHAYFANIIAVFIAASSIFSNILFYIREWVGHIKAKRKEAKTDDSLAQTAADIEETP
ncbi:MAG: YgjV family protein [Oscillospiraceae bacterium]|nr:YgjV family protein [Oscillospiraceae bacterium]